MRVVYHRAVQMPDPLSFFFLMIGPPRRSPLFPSTPLFRSATAAGEARRCTSGLAGQQTCQTLPRDEAVAGRVGGFVAVAFADVFDISFIADERRDARDQALAVLADEPVPVGAKRIHQLPAVDAVVFCGRGLRQPVGAA